MYLSSCEVVSVYTHVYWTRLNVVTIRVDALTESPFSFLSFVSLCPLPFALHPFALCPFVSSRRQPAARFPSRPVHQLFISPYNPYTFPPLLLQPFHSLSDPRSFSPLARCITLSTRLPSHQTTAHCSAFLLLQSVSVPLLRPSPSLSISPATAIHSAATSRPRLRLDAYRDT